MSSLATPEFANLSGFRVMVTGSSSGIGRAIALEIARAGGDVLVHCANSRSAAEQLAQEIRSLGVRSEVCLFDFTTGGFDVFIQDAWNRWGGLDAWINNAGADLLTGAGAQLSFAAKLEKLWQIDVQGTVHLSRNVMKRMKEAGRGVILNIGWDQADRGMEGDSAELFSIAKNAIMGFSRSLAMTAAPEVRVNCIAPGWILTAWGNNAGQVWQDRVIQETPLRRWGMPEDIARLARFLISNEAAYLTGQVVNANGGAVR